MAQQTAVALGGVPSRVQGPWSGGDEAGEVRVQGLRLLGRSVPDSGERSASVPDERLGPQVKEGCARDDVGGLGRGDIGFPLKVEAKAEDKASPGE